MMNKRTEPLTEVQGIVDELGRIMLPPSFVKKERLEPGSSLEVFAYRNGLSVLSDAWTNSIGLWSLWTTDTGFVSEPGTELRLQFGRTDPAWWSVWPEKKKGVTGGPGWRRLGSLFLVYLRLAGPS